MRDMSNASSLRVGGDTGPVSLALPPVSTWVYQASPSRVANWLLSHVSDAKNTLCEMLDRDPQKFRSVIDAVLNVAGSSRYADDMGKIFREVANSSSITPAPGIKERLVSAAGRLCLPESPRIGWIQPPSIEPSIPKLYRGDLRELITERLGNLGSNHLRLFWGGGRGLNLFTGCLSEVYGSLIRWHPDCSRSNGGLFCPVTFLRPQDMSPEQLGSAFGPGTKDGCLSVMGFAPLPPKSDVVVIGDLGTITGDDEAGWLKLGRDLREQGHRPMAIVPYLPPNHQIKHMEEVFAICSLAPPETVAGEVSDKRIVEVGAMLSFMVRVEPGLLAKLLGKDGHWNDPHLAQAIWSSGDLEGCSSDGASPSRQALELIPQFEELPLATRRNVLKHLRSWRAYQHTVDLVGPEIYFEEIARLSPKQHEIIPREDTYNMRGALEYIARVVEEEGVESGSPMVAFARRMISRMPDELDQLHPWAQKPYERIVGVLGPRNKTWRENLVLNREGP